MAPTPQRGCDGADVPEGCDGAVVPPLRGALAPSTPLTVGVRCRHRCLFVSQCSPPALLREARSARRPRRRECADVVGPPQSDAWNTIRVDASQCPHFGVQWRHPWLFSSVDHGSLVSRGPCRGTAVRGLSGYVGYAGTKRPLQPGADIPLVGIVFMILGQKCRYMTLLTHDHGLWPVSNLIPVTG